MNDFKERALRYHAKKQEYKARLKGVNTPVKREYRKIKRIKKKVNKVKWTRKKRKLSERETLILTLISRYGAICWYCGAKLTDSIHLDHIIPRAKKGSDSIHNRALACGFCNRAKWSLDADEFISWLDYVRRSKFKSKVE